MTKPFSETGDLEETAATGRTAAKSIQTFVCEAQVFRQMSVTALDNQPLRARRT
jgi:hypothetical protein